MPDTQARSVAEYLDQARHNAGRDAVPVADVLELLIASGSSRDYAQSIVQRALAEGEVALDGHFFLTSKSIHSH